MSRVGGMGYIGVSNLSFLITQNVPEYLMGGGGRNLWGSTYVYLVGTHLSDDLWEKFERTPKRDQSFSTLKTSVRS